MILLVTAVLFGCGGGDGSTPVPAPTQTETTFDLGKYVSLTPGSSYTLTFTGTDTAGATYTGSEQCNVVGSTTFEGKNVIQRSHVFNLIKSGGGGISGSLIEYFNPDRTLYKEVYSNGIVNTSTNIFALPVTVQPGSFEGQSISSSDGTSTSQTWQVNDAGNGTAAIVITSTTNQSLDEVDTLTVTTAGALISIKQVVYDFPSVGVTTTLTGVMN